MSQLLSTNWMSNSFVPLPEHERIRVYIIGREALVWRAQDVIRLREQYHITGTLLESLPRQPMQNLVHGLPLQLMSEEVTLLLELGVIRLVNDHEAYRTPTYDERMNYEDIQAKAERLRDEAVERRRQEMAAEYGVHSTTSTIEREHRSEVDTASTSFMVHIPTATPNVPWHREVLGWMLDVPISGHFPTQASNGIFSRLSDLWQRGWWLNSGLKFGGQFLVIQCHSTFVATVSQPHETRTFTHLIRLGRLGTTVRKARLLCNVQSTDDHLFTRWQSDTTMRLPVLQVSYLRIEWAGW
ncbi:hypothetical protein BDF22DRAFT_678662 [Syncephalis plumigaleata]|nr:hypothetical protein BDF22DRAFT_678662 [Syncephalis plumigaleata]